MLKLLRKGSAEGVSLDKPQAREIVYGMPYDEWREKHQRQASQEALKAFAEKQTDQA